MTTATMATGTRTTRTAAESELRAAARRRGLTMKELAALMGVSAGYLSQIANGGRPWTPKMREKVAAVLGEVPGQGTVYRQGGVVTGESSFIRERARTLGMTMQDLAGRIDVSYSLHMTGDMVDTIIGMTSLAWSVKVQAMEVRCRRCMSQRREFAELAQAEVRQPPGAFAVASGSALRLDTSGLGVSVKGARQAWSSCRGGLTTRASQVEQAVKVPCGPSGLGSS